MFNYSPSGMYLTSPINVVDDLQKKGVAPLVVVIQVSEPNNSSKDTNTPSKSALPQSNNMSEKNTLPHVDSKELFDLDNLESALSNKEEIDINCKAKSELAKPADNIII